MMKAEETIFIMTGSIPNKRSTPLVDEWFGLVYEGGAFKGSMSMNEVLKKTNLRSANIPNSNALTEDDVRKTSELLPDVVERAKEYLYGYFQQYEIRMNPLLDEELDKLAELESRHKDYQLSLFENEQKKSEQERMVDELFEKFINWVTDTLTIQNNPYIRIVAVLKGVAR